MEYQKIINLLDNTKNEPSKFKAKNWVDINDESRETYNEDNQIRFKTSMFTSSWYEYSDGCIFVKGTTIVENKAAQNQPNNTTNKKVILKNLCAIY